ncbi:MAG: hypothetical protein KC656_10950, partial [Myxococcales bacterium]|nr:hypothetical protein [Myxococcales bacterium]
RAYLDDCRLADEEAGHDRHAAIRRDQAAPRFRAWDKRLFGRPVDPATLDDDLAEVVMDRPLSAFPLAVPGIEPPVPDAGPFLERWEAPGLRVACPPTLAQLQGGVAAVNRLLREVRTQPELARVPSLVDPCDVVHGALLHPGEPAPRAVPDTRTLRSRVLMHAPYASMVAALLLVHRQQPHQLVVHRSKGRWRVRWGEEVRGPLLPFLDAFGLARGWVVARRPAGGLPDAALLDALEALGVVSVFGRQAVLSERFFGQLRTAPEESEVHARLAPLASALESWLGAGT